MTDDREALLLNNGGDKKPRFPDVKTFPVLTVEELMQLRIAQAGAERCAAYFGLILDDFTARVDADPELKKVFEAGPERGKAMIQKAQFEVALDGSENALKHFGEHNLGQKNKVEHGVDLASLQKAIEWAKSKCSQQEISEAEKRVDARLAAKNVIEGECEEVDGE